MNYTIQETNWEKGVVQHRPDCSAECSIIADFIPMIQRRRANETHFFETLYYKNILLDQYLLPTE